jgi:hypothetical protein
MRCSTSCGCVAASSPWRGRTAQGPIGSGRLATCLDRLVAKRGLPLTVVSVKYSYRQLVDIYERISRSYPTVALSSACMPRTMR